jgi:hypothetical protein
MSDGALSGFLVFAVLLGALVFFRWRELSAIRQGFELAGANDARIQWMSVVAGTVQGRAVRYATEMGIKNTRNNQGWTTVRAPIPTGAAEVEMHLTPETPREKHLVERGLAVDVEVGESQFDAAFLVEAAPAETVRAILDPATRSTLRNLRPCELHIADGEVLFRKPGKLIASFEVREVVELVAGVSARLASVGFEVQERRLQGVSHEDGAGYRGVTAMEASAKLGLRGESPEIARLQVVRGRRELRRLGMVAAAVLLVGVAWWAIVELGSRR